MATHISGPTCEGGRWLWRGGRGPVEVGFAGRGPQSDRRDVLRALTSRPLKLAWLRQVHSAKVVPARPDLCSEGDALTSGRHGLALCVSTADCVPILLASADRIAAVHAGWRGIAAGVVGAAVGALGRDPGRLSAWLGPAIGSCCYEVGEEVAQRVAAASHQQVVVSGNRGLPHLDLRLAVRHQLASLGVVDLCSVDACTGCRSEWLWSHRREGKLAGRNLAFVWLRRGVD